MGRADARLGRSLPLPGWLAGIGTITCWVGWRVDQVGIANLDRHQQLYLVQRLAHGDLRHAFTGDYAQASPPGYGFFALPFHLALHRVNGDLWSYFLSGWAALVLLAVAAVAALRARGVPARSVLELAGLAGVVGASTTLACLTEAFHPSDLVATAGVLLAYVAITRTRYGWAIAALGLALLMKQWVVVPIAVLAVTHQGATRIKLALGPLAVAAAAIAPFAVADAHDTFNAISAATVVSRDTTLISHLPLHSDGVRALEARLLPLSIVAGFCLWLEQRKTIFSPDLAMAALAVASLVRPLLDPAGYTYYAVSGVTFLVVSARSWRLPAAAVAVTFLMATVDRLPPAHSTTPRAAVMTAMLALLLGLAIAVLRSTLLSERSTADVASNG